MTQMISIYSSDYGQPQVSESFSPYLTRLITVAKGKGSGGKAAKSKLDFIDAHLSDLTTLVFRYDLGTYNLMGGR